MPGMSLRGGLGAGMNPSANGGLTPIPTVQSTGPRSPVTGQAWGFTNGRPRGWAAAGGVGIGVVSTVLLIALWWSLPR